MPDWLTVKEAAAYLKVHRDTIYSYCEAGRLPWYEMPAGKGRRFKREDLDSLLTPGTPSPGARAASPRNPK